MEIATPPEGRFAPRNDRTRQIAKGRQHALLFSQAGRTMRIVPSIGTQHQDSTMPGNSFPFSAGTSHNPTGDGEGSLVRHDGLDPLLIETNSDAE
jgi:hypothetical protein